MIMSLTVAQQAGDGEVVGEDPKSNGKGKVTESQKLAKAEYHPLGGRSHRHSISETRIREMMEKDPRCGTWIYGQV